MMLPVFCSIGLLLGGWVTSLITGHFLYEFNIGAVFGIWTYVLAVRVTR